jgi:hypothetical protein
LKEQPAYDASLVHDESYLATSHKGLVYPLGDHAPGAGELTRIADGISWARIPMPGSLGHINSWLLNDTDGLVAVDTGMLLTIVQRCLEGALRRGNGRHQAHARHLYAYAS